MRTFRQDLHPFEVAQVRGMVCRILAKQEQSIEYADYIALAKKRISEGFFEIAGVYAQKAVFLNPKRPEALNLLGESLKPRATGGSRTDIITPPCPLTPPTHLHY